MFMFILFLMIILALCIYFIPSFIAIGRKHAHVMQITILNTFLGWSFIPWVAALIWASTNHIDENVKTKGSWTIIGVALFLTILPIFLFSVMPPKYKYSVIQETQYKSLIYKNKSGNWIKQVTETKHVEEH